MGHGWMDGGGDRRTLPGGGEGGAGGHFPGGGRRGRGGHWPQGKFCVHDCGQSPRSITSLMRKCRALFPLHLIARALLRNHKCPLYLFGETVVDGQEAAELFQQNFTRRGVAVGARVEPFNALLDREKHD